MVITAEENFSKPIIEILSGFDVLGVTFTAKLVALADIKKKKYRQALKFSPDIIVMNITTGEVELFCFELFKNLSLAKRKGVFYNGQNSQFFNVSGAVRFDAKRLEDNEDRREYTRFLLLVKERLGVKSAKDEIYPRKYGKSRKIAVFFSSSRGSFATNAKYLLDFLVENQGYSFEYEYIHKLEFGNSVLADKIKKCQAGIIFVENQLLFELWFILAYSEMTESGRNRIVVFGDDELSEKLSSRIEEFRHLYVEPDDRLPIVVDVLENK
jgi:hypothetical protein